ncbi:MAG: Uma2 family endonuclease [Saprospiraceae bacterium]
MNPAKKIEKSRKITFEEYLALEQESEIRHEFQDGELIPLEATTKAHNRIKRNITRAIETPEFEERGCELYDENVLTQLQEKKRYVYPDVVVTCQPTSDPLIVVHPTIVFEILSPSTKKYDKTTKFFRYQRIPSLMQCIFVAQDEIEVKSFLRHENGQWVQTALDAIDDVLEIPDLQMSISLREIYRNIKFELEI